MSPNGFVTFLIDDKSWLFSSLPNPEHGQHLEMKYLKKREQRFIGRSEQAGQKVMRTYVWCMKAVVFTILSRFNIDFEAIKTK
jgi:hypothetical protein